MPPMAFGQRSLVLSEMNLSRRPRTVNKRDRNVPFSRGLNCRIFRTKMRRNLRCFLWQVRSFAPSPFCSSSFAVLRRELDGVRSSQQLSIRRVEVWPLVRGPERLIHHVSNGVYG